MTFCKASGLHKTTTGCDCEHCKPDERDYAATLVDVSFRSGGTVSSTVHRLIQARIDDLGTKIDSEVIRLPPR